MIAFDNFYNSTDSVFRENTVFFLSPDEMLLFNRLYLIKKKDTAYIRMKNHKNKFRDKNYPHDI